MSVSEKEKSLRRRLLFNSLPAGTSEDLVQQAIDLLDNEFGEDPRILYGALVKRLKETLGDRIKMHGVLGNIMVKRAKPESEIGPEPTLAGRSAPVATANPNQFVGSTGQKASDKVFNALFLEIVSTIRQRGSENATGLANHLTGQFKDMELSGKTQTTLQQWITNPSREPSVVGSTGDLHKIINSCFVWLCQTFGPVDADKVLLRGVRSAEQLPESFECSPRSFL